MRAMVTATMGDRAVISAFVMSAPTVPIVALGNDHRRIGAPSKMIDGH